MDVFLTDVRELVEDVDGQDRAGALEQCAVLSEAMQVCDFNIDGRF